MRAKLKSKLLELDVPYDVQEAGKTEFFLNCVARGETPRMAELLAMQQPPGIGITTAVFLQDQRRHGSSILAQYKNKPAMVERLRKDLAKNGYRLKSDDQYIATAARPGMSGDPQAIVNETQDHKTLERTLKERNERNVGTPKIVHRLNPKIVERIRRRKIAENPDLAHKNQAELRESIIDKHGSKVGLL